MTDEKRSFIRHPSSVPISYKQRGCVATNSLRDIGNGGLCFVAEQKMPIGEQIDINIPISQSEFQAEGVVCWCQPESKQRTYLIGVAFKNNDDRYTLRMVEQICHIEAYRRQILEKTGQSLTSQQAAQEWIQKYAAGFPHLD